jgi:hypothetical protein
VPQHEDYCSQKGNRCTDDVAAAEGLPLTSFSQPGQLISAMQEACASGPADTSASAPAPNADEQLNSAMREHIMMACASGPADTSASAPAGASGPGDTPAPDVAMDEVSPAIGDWRESEEEPEVEDEAFSEIKTTNQQKQHQSNKQRQHTNKTIHHNTKTHQNNTRPSTRRWARRQTRRALTRRITT